MAEVKEKSIFVQEFLNQINNIKNVFDLMAMCIYYILRENDGQKVDAIKMLNVSDVKCSAIVDLLNVYKLTKEIDIEYRCLKHLKMQLYNSLSESENIVNECMQIIMWIDNNWKPEYEDDEIYTYKALNRQFVNKIRIIPRMANRIDEFSRSCLDEKGHKAFRKDYPVRNFFYSHIVCRYIIMDESFLNDYDVQICHLGYKNAFVRKISDKQKISFAMFPLLNSDISEYFQINKFQAEKIAYFEINGMYQGKNKVLKQRYNKILSQCNSDNIDFLIFPEMLMTEDILDGLKKYKEENWIAFWGSFWKDLTNQCVVTGPGGRVLLTYDKKIGFDLKEEMVYSEHLAQKINKVPYAVLDIEKLGRVGVCICRDLTFQEVYNLHAYLETNFLIVPAFSESMDIYTGAEELAKKENCIVVLANSCSASYNKKSKERTINEVGFIVAPAKEGNSRSVYKKTYGHADCKNECKSFCKGILFTINFANKMEEEGLLSMEIIKEVVIS